MVRRWKTLSHEKRLSWEKRLVKDGIHEKELGRLVKAVTPGGAVQIRLGNVMGLYEDLELPRKTARALL